MPTWIQVGVGSGGMVVLDLLSRDEGLTAVTLIEPDVYQPHNAVRHYFPSSSAGQTKLDLAVDWLRARRPDLLIAPLRIDLLDPKQQPTVKAAVAAADFGVCAVDNEPAKYHWDQLMRRHQKPWTLGEVLSGGIGGFIHRFVPGGPCYGCVASHLQREAKVDLPGTPHYAQAGGGVPETTIPASAASIHAIASLHAQATLALLDSGANNEAWTSLLLTLRPVPGVFEQAFRTFRFTIPRLPGCLVCQPAAGPVPAEELDAALAQAMARLGDS